MTRFSHISRYARWVAYTLIVVLATFLIVRIYDHLNGVYQVSSSDSIIVVDKRNAMAYITVSPKTLQKAFGQGYNDSSIYYQLGGYTDNNGYPLNCIDGDYGQFSGEISLPIKMFGTHCNVEIALLSLKSRTVLIASISLSTAEVKFRPGIAIPASLVPKFRPNGSLADERQWGQ